jgi:hypothetical protein
MKFKLPRLYTNVDCEPIGYPGLLVRFWLNPTGEHYEPPENGEAWESSYWYGLGRAIQSITIPAEMTEDGEDVVIDVPDGKALYELVDTPGFDYQIVIWALGQYQEQRQARLQAELKN